MKLGMLVIDALPGLVQTSDLIVHVDDLRRSQLHLLFVFVKVTQLFFLDNLGQDLIVHGLVCIRAVVLRCLLGPLLLSKAYAVWVGNRVLHSTVHRLVDCLVKVDQALHASLSLWLLQFWFFLGRNTLHDDVLVALFVFLQLRIKSANILFLWWFSLLRLQLIDIANEWVLEADFCALSFLAFLHDLLQVAV